MKSMSDDGEAQGTKWRRAGGRYGGTGFVGGIALMACGEIINLISWRSRLLRSPLTARVTKPTKTGSPGGGGGGGGTTDQSHAIAVVAASPSCFHAAANSTY